LTIQRTNGDSLARKACAVLSNSGMSLEVRLDDDAERVDRLLK
jgi:hypothetical protein